MIARAARPPRGLNRPRQVRSGPGPLRARTSRPPDVRATRRRGVRGARMCPPKAGAGPRARARAPHRFMSCLPESAPMRFSGCGWVWVGGACVREWVGGWVGGPWVDWPRREESAWPRREESRIREESASLCVSAYGRKGRLGRGGRNTLRAGSSCVCVRAHACVVGVITHAHTRTHTHTHTQHTQPGLGLPRPQPPARRRPAEPQPLPAPRRKADRPPRPPFFDREVASVCFCACTHTRHIVHAHTHPPTHTQTYPHTRVPNLRQVSLPISAHGPPYGSNSPPALQPPSSLPSCRRVQGPGPVQGYHYIIVIIQ